MKTLALGVLAVIVVVVLAGAAVWPSVSDAPWEVQDNSDASPTTLPTSEARFLTSGEAAGKADALSRKLILEADVPTVEISFTCETEDYNDRSRDWIVRCAFSGPGPMLVYRMRVNDRTGTVSLID